MMGLKGRWSALRRLSHVLSLCLIFHLFVPMVAGDSEEPSVKKTEFDHFLSEIPFFEDSEVVLGKDSERGEIWRSTDSGKTWAKEKDIEGVVRIFMHPTNNKVAVALTMRREDKHWITRDQGSSWDSFETEYPPDIRRSPISFHADDPDKIIINTGSTIAFKAVYTTDGFKSSPKALRENAVRCIWAKETPEFEASDEKALATRALCITFGKFSERTSELRLLVSNDYFKESEEEPSLEPGRPVSGIVNMVAVKGYILAARQSKSASDEMALYVTKDSKRWRRARFDQQQIQEGGYTIMESTNYSVQVAVATGVQGAPMGMLFTSNSDGNRFRKNMEHANSNEMGYLDFEKVQNIQGIFLVNQVDNPEDVQHLNSKKKLTTKITFDDGRTFEYLKTKDKDNKLHLHSMTDPNNVGRVYSSPAAGVVMGVGNTGDYLLDYYDGDLCVSDDAGMTWACPLEGPHKYEFGDQGSVLLAIYDREPTTEMKYSLDHGKSWEKFKLGDDAVKPEMLTTVPDSTSLKFVLQASTGKGSDTKHWMYFIDFDDLDVKQCSNDDFEKWYARPDSQEKGQCIMGHKQSFHRRKPDVKCFIKREFKEELPDNSEKCPCTKRDFECDLDFEREGDDCVPGPTFEDPPGKCKSPGDKYTGRSGWRRIPGNQCDSGKGEAIAQPKERTCMDGSKKTPKNGEISHEITHFEDARKIQSFYYLEKSELSEGADETVVTLSDQRKVYISFDHGKKWESVKYGDEEIREVIAIVPNYYHRDHVYFITSSRAIYFSPNRGKKIEKFDAPGPLATSPEIRPIRFHPTNADWLILITCEGESGITGICPNPVAHYTLKAGREWHVLLDNAQNCEFVYAEGVKGVSEKLVFCVQYGNGGDSAPKTLLSSDDWFEGKKKVAFKNVLDFATKSEFVVVAAKTGEDNQYLKVDATVDRKVFADAKFPPEFDVPHQSAYTVLDSSTHSIFLHVTTNSIQNQEYGSILKSNENGTAYTMSIDYVNRNTPGYVDFEKLMVLEGLAVVNVVANAQDVNKGRAKKLKTMITHNDGAQWSLIKAPAKDPDGKSYGCKDLKKCSLHLHGYTERRDFRDTSSSASAVGMMMGIGNVGEFLTPRGDGDTFISKDGGVEWSALKKGRYMWEYGDQGSVIVIVAEQRATNVVYYSLNEGKDWQEYQFSDSEMQVEDITTVPSDTSLNFLLWGFGSSSDSQAQPITVNIDFSGLFPKQCNLDTSKPGSKDNDYELWTPDLKNGIDGESSECIFGHIPKFWRKKLDRQCYNGPIRDRFHDQKNCKCTRRDFECDYNYARRESDDRCILVSGHEPPNAQEACEKNSSLVEYRTVNGYRKLQISTCEGNEEKFLGQLFPCPGHESEFEEKHGISGAGLFFAVVIPIGCAAAIGWWVYRRYEGRFGLGRIRLGEDPPTIAALSPKSESAWVRWPVTIISGVAAAAMAVPMILGTLVRSVSERVGRGGGGGSWHSRARGVGAGGRPYTSRGSFARSRGEYSAIGANPESDLLGEDDSDDDI